MWLTRLMSGYGRAMNSVRWRVSTLYNTGRNVRYSVIMYYYYYCEDPTAQQSMKVRMYITFIHRSVWCGRNWCANNFTYSTYASTKLIPRRDLTAFTHWWRQISSNDDLYDSGFCYLENSIVEMDGKYLTLSDHHNEIKLFIRMIYALCLRISITSKRNINCVFVRSLCSLLTSWPLQSNHAFIYVI